MKDKPLYSVHDLCEIAGVSRKTLWYYDHAGLLKPVCRAGNQKAKMYDESSLNELKKIIRWRQAGLMVSEIRAVQRAGQKNEILVILRQALKRLEHEKKTITSEIDLLKEIIAKQEHV